MKIRTRLLIASVALFAAGGFWLVDWLLQDFRFHYYTTMEESLVDTSTLLASIVSEELAENDTEPSEEFKAGIANASHRELSAIIYDFAKTNMNLQVLVMDQNGIVTFDSSNGEAEGLDYSEWRDFKLAFQGEYGARASTTDSSDMQSLTFFIGSPLIVNGETLGVLSVGKPVRSILPIMRKAKRRLIFMCIAAVTAVLLIQVLVSSWVTRPIRELIAYARAVRDGKMSPRPTLESGEMSELANAFEEMRDALEGRKYVEDYVQSLTHEMKSPLAAIRGAVELLEEEMPDEQRKRFLQNIHTESTRLHGLVDRMLALASIEKRKELTHAERIDRAVFIDDISSSLAPALQQKEMELKLIIADDIKLYGEYFLLRQALMNLLQNAIEFSAVGSKVELHMSMKPDTVCIEVIDQGAGIPDYAMARLFDRFYSLARPGKGEKSSGLGLNFVQQIARLHGGDIILKNRPSGGVIAALTLLLDPE